MTYRDICDKLFPSQYLYITPSGGITSDDLKEGKYDKNSSPSEEQLQKVLAINQLYNIARYYNKGWEPNWSFSETKYFIYLKGDENELCVGNTAHNSHTNVYFKYEEDAQTVIDNPNFKDILDTIFK